MQAVILAAGIGKRLRPITDRLPKALIEIGGKTLLEHSLDNLIENGIKEAVVVIGFQGDSIKKKIGYNYCGMDIKYVVNEEYNKTGSMYSFSKAKDIINNEVILLESDLLYDPKAIKVLLDSNFKDCILVSKLSESGDEVYVCVDENRKITDLGKNITRENKKNAIGELVGISKLSKEFLRGLFKEAEDCRHKKLNYHYEECTLATTRLGSPVFAVLCNELLWIEIDNAKDLLKAKNHTYPEIKRILKR